MFSVGVFDGSLEIPGARLYCWSCLSLLCFDSQQPSISHSISRLYNMGIFRALFRRSSKHAPTRKESDDAKVLTAQPVTSHGCGVDIAALPVAGMQRTAQAPFILSHTANTMRRPSPDTSSASNATASSVTAVDTAFVSQRGESHWQGKPQGKSYDKREELSADDEDMWANMAT